MKTKDKIKAEASAAVPAQFPAVGDLVRINRPIDKMHGQTGEVVQMSGFRCLVVLPDGRRDWVQRIALERPEAVPSAVADPVGVSVHDGRCVRELPALKVSHDPLFPLGHKMAHYHASRFIVTADCEWAESGGDDNSWEVERGSVVATMRDCSDQGALARVMAAAPQLLGALRALYVQAASIEPSARASAEWQAAFKLAADAITLAAPFSAVWRPGFPDDVETPNA